MIAADHGEGLGDHGELQHGNLLYESTMRVPLAVVGPGVNTGDDRCPGEHPADLPHDPRLGRPRVRPTACAAIQEVVLGEAMKPYMNYGWQPQIMATSGQQKAIFAGRIETYDLGADPGETRDLGVGNGLPPAMRKALDEYPVPVPGEAPAPQNLTEEARRNLASLGYVSGTATPVVRKDAPRPVDMVSLFPTLDRASWLFVRERYAEALPLFRKILAGDPHNLDAALRLATSYSMLEQNEQALAAFRQAASIAPRSADVRLYLALHYTRGKDWPQAVPILEQTSRRRRSSRPSRGSRRCVRNRDARRGRPLRQKVLGLRPPTAAIVRWATRDGAGGTRPRSTHSRAPARPGCGLSSRPRAGRSLLSARSLPEARDALDRVPPSHPGIRWLSSSAPRSVRC